MSLSYNDMQQMSSRAYHNFHQKMDNTNHPLGQQIQRDLYKFKEMTQGNHSDPRHIADAAHRLERSLNQAKHSGQNFISSGDLESTRRQFENIYQTTRYMHHF